MSDSVESRVCRVVADVMGLPPESVTRATTRDAVSAWDSLAIVNLMMALESEFDVFFEAEEAGELTAVEAILGLLSSKGIA
jgi:acyl carrier protein